MKKILPFLNALCLAALLFPVSQQVQAQQAQEDENEVLFKCSFFSQTDFDTNWTVTDFSSWKWRTLYYGMGNLSHTDDGSSCAQCIYPDGETEYLTLKNPVKLKAGVSTFLFYWGSMNEFPVTFEIRYGKGHAPEQMEVLKSYEGVFNEFYDGIGEWMEAALYVNLEEADTGEYYFAVGCSDGFLILDDVQVLEGEFKSKPVFNVSSVELPLSSCALGMTDMTVHVTNRGTAAADSVKITCLLNGEKAWDSLFTDTLNIGDTAVYNCKVDLTLPDAYTVTVIASLPEEEPVADDKAAEAFLQHWLPAELPFYTEFADSTSVYDWAVEGNIWEFYPDMGFVMSNGYGPLFSRCMEFKKGTAYRFSTTFLCGFEGQGHDFDILYGPSGTDYTTWDTVRSFRNVYTNDEAVSGYIDFVSNLDGEAALAIVGYGGRMLYFHNIRISEVYPYDVKVFQYDHFPTQMPAKQINREFSLWAVTENEGLETVDSVIMSVSLDETVAGSRTFPLGEPGAYVIGEIPVKASGLTAGDSLTLYLRTGIKGHEDQYDEDNEISQDLTVTDTVFTYDLADESMCDNTFAVGGPNALVGVPMLFLVKDTLTGVQVFWTRSTAFDFPLSLYRFDDVDETLQELLYTGTFHKDTAKGAFFYPINPMVVEPGYYMITLQVNDYCLVTDHVGDGQIYRLAHGRLIAEDNYGYAAVRAVFGHNHPVYAKDAAVEEILKLRDRQVFTENQPLTAVITNNGYQMFSATVKARINDTELEPQAVIMEAYSRKEVTFTADMAAPGTYKITVRVELNGDENPANNTMERTVECLESADPYIMNFENCDDFSDYAFNPAWQSIDLDGAYTNDFFWKFPGMGGKFGFIAMSDTGIYNMENLPMDEEEAAFRGLKAYEGHKYGAAIWSIGAVNDDWLISPVLDLGPEPSLSYMIKSYNAYYGGDVYQVLVSKKAELDFDADPNESVYGFTLLFEDTVTEQDWVDMSLDLSEYKDREMSVAIRCISNSQYMLMIDDIRIHKNRSSVENAPVAASLKLYPNPAHEAVIIKSDAGTIEQVSIFNVSGREIYASSAAVRTEFRYNVSGLTAGIYFARVRTSEGTATLKFVVK